MQAKRGRGEIQFKNILIEPVCFFDRQHNALSISEELETTRG
jgi:hypothetical protein